MAVIAYNANFGKNGHADSMAAFMRAHTADTAALINLANGREPNDPLPPYDPNHPDNQWPKAAHHPTTGMLEVGTSLKGVTDSRQRASITAANEKAYAAALAAGHRAEPYAKPQITVLDPAREKLELKRQLDEQQGQITALLDQVTRLTAKPAV